MEGLLPDRLKELWGRVDTGDVSPDAAQQEQEVLLDEYRAIWTKALVRENEVDLKHSLLSELATYLNRADLVEIEARCRAIGSELRAEWEQERSCLLSMASRWRSRTSAHRCCDLLNGDLPSEGYRRRSLISRPRDYRPIHSI